jgi:hypothetical protein
MRLKFHSFEFYTWASLKAVFHLFLKIKTVLFKQVATQNAEDGTHQISFKIN